MELKKGVVEKIRFSTEVEGGKNDTSTIHIAIFEVDGTPIQIKSSSMIVLNDGDDVVIAGEESKGIFEALAYKNITKGVSGESPGPGMKAFALWLVVVGIICFSLMPWISILLFVFGVVLIVVSCTNASKINDAHELVKNTK